MKRLLLDIETAPNIAHCWGLWDQTIGLNQLLASGYVLCWSAKWYGEKEVLFDKLRWNDRKKKLVGHKRMLRGIHKLIDEADAVIHYNGKSFDMPTLNKEFILHAMPPPAPYKQIDLCNVAKSTFRFPSNKLEYIAKALGVTPKVTARKFQGHTLWTECMAGNDDAWKEMEKYNRGDVITLGDVYTTMLPWIPNHPNHGLYDEPGRPVCPSCGSKHLQRRGVARTRFNKFARYQCKDCGSWSRAPASILPAEERKQIMRTDLG